MIDSDPDTYIEGLWFIGNGDMDVFASLTKKKDERWKFKYRFRYYKGENAFDGADDKRQYGVTFTISDLALIKAELRPIIKEIAKEMPGKTHVDYVILQCQMDDEKILRKLKKFKWCHFKEIGPNQ